MNVFSAVSVAKTLLREWSEVLRFASHVGMVIVMLALTLFGGSK